MWWWVLQGRWTYRAHCVQYEGYAAQEVGPDFWACKQVICLPTTEHQDVYSAVWALTTRRVATPTTVSTVITHTTFITAGLSCHCDFYCSS